MLHKIGDEIVADAVKLDVLAVEVGHFLHL